MTRPLLALSVMALLSTGAFADTFLSEITATANGDRIESLSYAAELNDEGNYAWGTVEGWHCLDYESNQYSSMCFHFDVFHAPYSGYINVFEPPGCHTARLYWFFVSIAGQPGLSDERTASACIAGTPPLIRHHLAIWINVDGTFSPGGGSGDYDAGSTINIFTSAPAGYQFLGWNGDVTSSDLSTSVYMDRDKTVTAWWHSPPPPPDPGPGPNYCANDDGIVYRPDCMSPIIFNVGRGGYELSGPDDPVDFDINATGTPVRISWTARGGAMAFLALDRDGNGKIDDGAELFGNRTPLSNGARAANGFEALAQYDLNHDGVIDAEDPVWSSLLLWTDLSHDGICQPTEVVPIGDSDVTAIGLDYHWTGRRDSAGNQFGYESKVWLRNGANHATPRPAYDIFFVAAPNTVTLK